MFAFFCNQKKFKMDEIQKLQTLTQEKLISLTILFNCLENLFLKERSQNLKK